ncbi:MAG: hypothetical protein U5P10_08980 [Spirochaetia bacterium]|nr:hypothetical protein [Spirochaetia bacterium]
MIAWWLTSIIRAVLMHSPAVGHMIENHLIVELSLYIVVQAEGLLAKAFFASEAFESGGPKPWARVCSCHWCSTSARGQVVGCDIHIRNGDKMGG